MRRRELGRETPGVWGYAEADPALCGDWLTTDKPARSNLVQGQRSDQNRTEELRAACVLRQGVRPCPDEAWRPIRSATPLTLNLPQLACWQTPSLPLPQAQLPPGGWD